MKNVEKETKKQSKTITKKTETKETEITTITERRQISNEEEPIVLFQNVFLVAELNTIRNTKIKKNISAGVKLCRQYLDI